MYVTRRSGSRVRVDVHVLCRLAMSEAPPCAPAEPAAGHLVPDPTEACTGPLLLGADQAAEFLGLSRSVFYRADLRGDIPAAVRIGRLRRWSRLELRLWVERGCPARHRWEAMRP